jgi:methyl-accepting chemotaxis protein
MLMMRRHEKDFMLRGTEKYVGRIAERRAEFEQILAESFVDEAGKAEISKLLAAYHKDFLAYAALSMEVIGETKMLSTIYEKVTPRLEAVFEAAEAGQRTATAELEQARDFASSFMMIAAIVMLISVLAIGLLIARNITAGLSRITGVMGSLAEGDNQVEIPALEKRTETGQMAQALQVFKDNAIEKEHMDAARAKEQAAKEDEAKRVMELCATFDQTAASALESVASAATQMQSTSQGMSATAEETNQQASAVASASEQATANVQTVATAAEEMSASIGEIGRQVEQSAAIATRAVSEAEKTNGTVQGLAEAAEKIGAVVELITGIAEQTNLLALNATIEAARAGDAGKGFAVVASEVKNLANQTAKATEEIGQQIAGMQSASGEAVEAIGGIGKTISEVNEIAAAIAAAVEQQGTATQDIARNVQEAAGGTQEVTNNITGVSQGAEETGKAANQVLESAGELSQQSEALRGAVDKFLVDIKAA